MHIQKQLHKAKTQGGFTLIELLVVIGILAILLAITLIAINPSKHFQDSRNAQRSSNVTAILNGIYEYESANNGNVPPSLDSATTTATEISSSAINLCADVVPTYLANLPTDPGLTSNDCTDGTYDTGYQIKKTSSGRFTVLAPSTEPATAPEISVTR
jgi:type IV pilus assembly protein PilA